MMNAANIEKMNALMANEEFTQKIADAGSYENAYALLVENGVDATYEEFTAFLADCRAKMVENGMISEDGELGVELLDMVSGGGKGKAIALFGLAAAAFYCGCPQAGALLIVAGIAVWKKK